MPRHWGLISLAAFLALAGLSAAYAGPLEPAACDLAGSEADKLEKGDAPGQITKGPDGARDSLSAGQLADIARLIELRETLEFRCGRGGQEVQAATEAQPKAVPKRKKAASAPVNNGDNDAPAAAAEPKAQPKPKPKAKPVAAVPTEAEASAPPQKSAPKPRPKSNDAFQPPPPKPKPATSEPPPN